MTRTPDRDPIDRWITEWVEIPLGRWALGRVRWLIHHVEGLPEMERWACYGLVSGAAISAVLLAVWRLFG